MLSELPVTSHIKVKSTGDDVPSILMLMPMACEVASLVVSEVLGGITLSTGSDKMIQISFNSKHLYLPYNRCRNGNDN